MKKTFAVADGFFGGSSSQDRVLALLLWLRSETC